MRVTWNNRKKRYPKKKKKPAPKHIGMESMVGLEKYKEVWPSRESGEAICDWWVSGWYTWSWEAHDISPALPMFHSWWTSTKTAQSSSISPSYLPLPLAGKKKKNKSYLPLSFSNNLFIFLAHFASYLDSFSSCLIFPIRLTALIMAEPKSLLYLLIWASLGTWWWRIRLPVQKMWVHSLGWEDPLD